MARGLLVTTVLYLHGLAGHPGVSPALASLAQRGLDVVAPTLPGFDGPPGWESPVHYLDWLVAVWDTVDATGALPCPVVGASVGGMLAAELAVLRPEAVTQLALLSPLGLFDPTQPGDDLWTRLGDARLAHLFAGEVPAPFHAMFADRGPVEAPVARYLAWVAAASLVWPLPDHGLAKRLHRLRAPTMVLWGDADPINPVHLLERWPGTHGTVAGAGHYVEWDAPDEVARHLGAFLR